MIALVSLFAVVLIGLGIYQYQQSIKLKQFRRYIDNELSPKVSAQIKQELTEARCQLYPNNDTHLEATLFYWRQYHIRVLQAALARKIISHKWLEKTGNSKNCQRIFRLEQAHRADEPIEKTRQH